MQEGTGIVCRQTTADEAAALNGIWSGALSVQLANGAPVTPNRDNLLADYPVAVFSGYADASLMTVLSGRDANNDDCQFVNGVHFQAANPIVTPDTVSHIAIYLPGAPSTLLGVIPLDEPIEVQFPDQSIDMTLRFNVQEQKWYAEVSS